MYIGISNFNYIYNIYPIIQRFQSSLQPQVEAHTEWSCPDQQYPPLFGQPEGKEQPNPPELDFSAKSNMGLSGNRLYWLYPPMK